MRNAERPPRSNYRCGASESSIQLVGIKGSDPFIPSVDVEEIAIQDTDRVMEIAV
jgi:hypothetical protein